MAKTIGFIIEIEGTQKTLNTAKEINQSIKEINKTIEKTDDPKRLQQLNKNLNQLKGQLSNVRKEQKQAQKEFAAANFGVGSVIKMKTELKGLELQFEKLSKEERNLLKGKKLAKRIKGLRNEIKAVNTTLGKERLSDIIGKGLKEQLPILNKFQKGIGGLGSSASLAGKFISGAFAAFAVGGLAIEGLQKVNEFVEEFKELSRQVEITFDVTGKKAQELTGEIKASSDTFGTDFEENIRAVNAVVQTFGVEASEAVALVDKALLSAARQDETLGNIATDLEKLSSLGIDEASALALIVEAGNKDFNIDAFTKVTGALRGQSEATVQSLQEAFGEETTNKIFETFAEAPLEAVKLVSKEFGELDDKSLESANILKDVFQASTRSGEDLATIKSLSEINTSLEDLQQNAGKTANAQRELLEANKELASAQAEVAAQLTGASEGAKLFGTRVKTFLFQTLSSLFSILEPVTSAFKNLFGAIGEIIQSFGFFQEEGAGAKGVIEFLLGPLKLLATALSTVANFLAGTTRAVKDFIDQSPVLQGVVKGITAPFKALSAALSSLPAVFNGVVAAAQQAGTNIGNFFNKVAIDAQILLQRLQQFNPFGPAQEDIDKQIKVLEAQRKKLEEETIGVFEAFTNAFNKTLEDREKLRKEAQAEAVTDTQANLAQITEEERKAQAIRTKQQKEASKKRREERRKAQEKQLQEVEKGELARLMLFQELSKRLLKAEIQNIQIGRFRAIKEERLKFAQLQETREKQIEKVIGQAKKQEEDLLKVFGEGSKVVLDFRVKSQQDLLAINEQSQAIEAEQAKEHKRNLAQIEKDFSDQASQERVDQLNQQLEGVEQAFNLEELKLRELRAKNLAGEKEFFEARKEAILEQVALLTSQEEQLEAVIKLGVEVEDSEFEEIILKRQQLNTELAELEAEQTRNVETNVETRSTSRIEEFQKSFQEIAGFVNQGLGLVSGFLDIAAQKDQARLDTAIEQRETALSDLNDRLGEASGLEKKFIQQQIDEEISARERLAKEQERISKKVARQQKAIALVQATINGALAVTNVLATLIDPTPVQAFKAVAVAFTIATTLAQIATIAAQPLAGGGIVEPVQLSDGKITRARNIPTMRNGDNILATVKRGEVVLNKSQQSSLGGAPVLRAARVPGFANGGLAGAPITAPITSSTLAGATGQDFTQVVNLLQKSIVATNNRMDRLSVNLDLDTFDETQGERNNIKKTAQLS